MNERTTIQQMKPISASKFDSQFATFKYQISARLDVRPALGFTVVNCDCKSKRQSKHWLICSWRWSLRFLFNILVLYPTCVTRYYERCLSWTGLLWMCMLWTWSAMNMVSYELVCYEQVNYERGLL